MKYRAKCTYCIAQMANTYPDRRKNPMPTDKNDTYIELDTETEFDYVEGINEHMHKAYVYLQELINYIETEKL